MNRVIWKFPIGNGKPVPMPVGAKILAVRPQYEEVCIWALVDPAKSLEPRDIRILPTGQEFDHDPERWVYIDTIQFNSPVLVFHIFEVLP